MRELEKLKERAQKLLKDALIGISYQYPYFIKFTLQTKFIENLMLPSFAGVAPTIGEVRVYYNPIFYKDVDLPQVVDILLHEYWHIVLKHCWVRLPDSTRDNIASDMEINQKPFLESKFISHIGVTYEKYNLPPRKSREWYYDHLPKEKSQSKQDSKGDSEQNQSGKSSQENQSQKENQDQAQGGCTSLDDHSKWKEADVQASEQYWKRVASEVLDEIRKQGTLPGGLVEEIQAKWQKRVKSLTQILRRLAEKATIESETERLTRKRPSRRFPLFPGEVLDYGPRIAIAVDTSGSMSIRDLEEIYSIIRWISKQVSSLVLLQCDAELTDVKELNQQKLPTTITVKGRGGTDFRPVFKYIEEKYNNKVDLLIFCTDLYGTFPDKEPPYKVVWLTTTDQKAPFGTTIKYRED